MAALQTVGDYVQEVRTLLQDFRVPYRYSDAELVRILNIGLQEAYRLRADLFLSALDFTVPDYDSSDVGVMDEDVPLEKSYRPAFTYYMVGRAQLRDDEATTDQRAGALLQKFVGQMLQIQS